MSVHYRTVLDDLLRPVSEEEMEYDPPYDQGSTLEEKFTLTLKALSRAKRFHNRPLQLLNAYFLGQLLETKTESHIQRNYYARRLSTHYRLTAVKAFIIFESFGPRKIMNTAKTSLTTIRQLSMEEYHDLVIEAQRIFNGVENLEGE
jgi:hypothetical protein